MRWRASLPSPGRNCARASLGAGSLDRMSSAGDLGILLMHELTLTYGPCERELGALLEEWELRLYDGSTPRGEIAVQRRALRELGNCAPICAMDRPAEPGRDQPPSTGPGCPAVIRPKRRRSTTASIASFATWLNSGLRCARRSISSTWKSTSASASGARRCNDGSRSSPRSS